MQPTIRPVLSIRGAARAVDFYKEAFGAVESNRVTGPTGTIVAELSIEGAGFVVADESPEHGNLSPESLNGTSVRIGLIVADPDAVASRAISAGANEIAPVADQDYGYRQGRIVDPFGHHWLVGRPLAGRD
jgi:PhnB protein